MRPLSQIELLRELEPVAEANLERHLDLAKPWNPHDYIPWSDGRNFAMLGGDDWSPEQSTLSKVAKAAMVTNLLTEDNLPSYHRGLAENFSMDGAWGAWVGRWTAEENRHGIVMRDYLVVTRSVDPVALEQARMEHMTVGIDSPMEGANLLHGVAYVTFQELATRVSHRNTGKACNDPIADALLGRIAADENLHMIFYRNMCASAIELAPDQTMKAIADVVMNFQMPGLNQPDFRRNAVLIAKYGIYDLRQHLDEVIMPVLRKWKLFERTDFGPEGERLRELVADFLADLEKQAVKFEESRDRALARERERGEVLSV